MTHLTESQAWLTIAEAYYNWLSRRSSRQITLSNCGCCWAIKNLRGEQGIITDEIYFSMERKIIGCLTDGGGCHSGKYFLIEYNNRRNDLLRADFCFLMHFACEDE